MKKRSRFYPRVQVDTADVPAVGQAGGVLLTDTVHAAGLDTALSTALSPWRRPLAIHDPGKVLLDLALTLAVGGDCLADIGRPDNEELVKIVRDLRNRSRLYGLEAIAKSGVLDRSVAEHGRMIDLALAGDRPAPEALVAQHIGRVRTLWADSAT